MRSLARLLSIIAVLCLSRVTWGEPLRVVAEPWAPYEYLENGVPQGLDYEITSIVFERLGIQLRWEFLPWKRCVQMLDQGQADVIVELFKTTDRQANLIFPDEPLVDAEFVLYYARARPHPVEKLEDLAGLTVGTSPGYLYNPEFLNSPLFNRETAPTHEANFGKLIRDRIDLLITDRRAGRYLTRQMGIGDQVAEAPLVVVRQPYYLAVRKGSGMDLLTARFSAELKRFKQEPGYQQLLERYSGADALTRNAGEAQAAPAH